MCECVRECVCLIHLYSAFSLQSPWRRKKKIITKINSDSDQSEAALTWCQAGRTEGEFISAESEEGPRVCGSNCTDAFRDKSPRDILEGVSESFFFASLLEIISPKTEIRWD